MRDRVLEFAERATDGDRQRADGNVVAIGKRRRFQTLRRHLEYSDIGEGIASDELRARLPIVGEDDVEGSSRARRPRILDHMIVRDDVALSRVDDESGTARLRLAVGRVVDDRHDARQEVSDHTDDLLIGRCARSCRSAGGGETGTDGC